MLHLSLFLSFAIHSAVQSLLVHFNLYLFLVSLCSLIPVLLSHTQRALTLHWTYLVCHIPSPLSPLITTQGIADIGGGAGFRDWPDGYHGISNRTPHRIMGNFASRDHNKVLSKRYFKDKLKHITALSETMYSHFIHHNEMNNFSFHSLHWFIVKFYAKSPQMFWKKQTMFHRVILRISLWQMTAE